MTEAAARQVLEEMLVRWSVGEATSAEVVQDAADAVADGAVSRWVVDLACLPSDATAEDIEDAPEAAPADVGVQLVPRGNPQAVLAAVVVMAQRCSAGHLAERDLTRWAHAVIGHGRSDEFELLVSLDDVYDTVEYTGGTIESVDEQVRAEADRLGALRPHA